MYVLTYTKGTRKKKKKRSSKGLCSDAYAMFMFVCFFVFFFLIFFIHVNAYVMGTHLNCINKLMQFKWVPTTYVLIRKKTRSTLAVI